MAATRFALAIVFTMVALSHAPYARGDDATDSKSVKKAKEVPLEELINQLGHESFIKRKAASAKITALGLAARPALLAAVKHPDLEVRTQARRLLIQAVQSDFESRLAAFVSDIHDRHDHGFPAWSGFRDIAGKSRGTRRLFAEMIRAETPLLASLTDKASAKAKLTKRVQKLQQAMYGNFGQRQIPAPTIATLLYMASRPDQTGGASLASQLNSLLSSYSTPMTAFTSGNHRDLMRHLLRYWLLRKGQNSSEKYYGVSLAMKYDLQDEGVQLAREVLAAPSLSSYMVQHAIIAIGKFGDQNDMHLLAPHLKDQTVCHTWSNRQIAKEPIRVQVRDVVLCMLIRLSQQDPREYGYRLLVDYPETIYASYSYGFVTMEERNKTIAKWNAFADKNKIPHKAPVLAAPKKTKANRAAGVFGIQLVPRAAKAAAKATKAAAKATTKKKSDKKKSDSKDSVPAKDAVKKAVKKKAVKK